MPMNDSGYTECAGLIFVLQIPGEPFRGVTQQ